MSIFGAHAVLHSTDAAADRTFLREVLGLEWVDAGHGWLIFCGGTLGRYAPKHPSPVRHG